MVVYELMIRLYNHFSYIRSFDLTLFAHIHADRISKRWNGRVNTLRFFSCQYSFINAAPQDTEL